MTDERVSELDGMRGLGMIIVVAYHIFKRGSYFTTNPVLHFFTTLSLYGWYSLSTFYVLSGFLIATILLRTKGKKHYFKNFYARRALRVLPLYYFTLALIMCSMPLLEPEYVSEIPRALPYYLFYLTNFLHFMSDIRGTAFLAVVWSLAIEEQFYLLFPLLVYYARKETLAKVCIGIIGVSVLARVLAPFFFWTNVHEMTNFFFYNTWTRFEEIAFGALIAVAFTFPEWKSRLSRIAMPVFLIAYAALLVIEVIASTGMLSITASDTLLMITGYTLASVFAAALIVALRTQSETSLVRRIFRNKTFIFWGQHSYSIYLYHVPVGVILGDVLWRYGFRGWLAYFLYIGLTYAITVLIALLTWHLLEMPTLSLKKYFEY